MLPTTKGLLWPAPFPVLLNDDHGLGLRRKHFIKFRKGLRPGRRPYLTRFEVCCPSMLALYVSRVNGSMLVPRPELVQPVMQPMMGKLQRGPHACVPDFISLRS